MLSNPTAKAMISPVLILGSKLDMALVLLLPLLLLPVLIFS